MLIVKNPIDITTWFIAFLMFSLTKLTVSFGDILNADMNSVAVMIPFGVGIDLLQFNWMRFDRFVATFDMVVRMAQILCAQPLFGFLNALSIAFLDFAQLLFKIC